MASDAETVSELAERHIRSRLKSHPNLLQQQQGANIPSLVSLITDQIVQELEQSEDIDAAVSQLEDWLEPIPMGNILNTPKASYRLLRAFHRLHVGPGRRAFDFDEAIARNEQYLRSRCNLDGKYLVGLEELVDCLYSEVLEIGACLDHKDEHPCGDGQQVRLSIISSSESFSRQFDLITSRILQGLDWSNVLLTGGLVSHTLMHPELTSATFSIHYGFDVEIHMYGLGPEDATRKAEEIYNTWAENLPAFAKKAVCKSPGALSLLTTYPFRRVRILLKLASSPTNILLGINCDQHAIGFDGSSVYMLPRCARELENEYLTRPRVYTVLPGSKAIRNMLAEGLPANQLLYERELSDLFYPSKWLDSDRFEQLQAQIDQESNRMFCLVKTAICKRLNVQPGPNSDYQNYLTRRIRRHVLGADFQAVLQKQITIPLFLPCQLEEYLVHRLGNDYPEQASSMCESIIPLHDSTKYDAAQASLPSLTDTTTGYGNLRYWVITNTSMWTGQHSVLDVVADTLRSLHFLCVQNSYDTDKLSTLGPAQLREWHQSHSSRASTRASP